MGKLKTQKNSHKVGDIVYWENYNGTIGCDRITKIIPDNEDVDDNGKKYKYDYYELGNTCLLEDYNCLSETDPRVVEFKKNYKEPEKMVSLNKVCQWLDMYIDDYLFLDARKMVGIKWDEFINDLKDAMQ